MSENLDGQANQLDTCRMQEALRLAIEHIEKLEEVKKADLDTADLFNLEGLQWRFIFVAYFETEAIGYYGDLILDVFLDTATVLVSYEKYESEE